MSSGQYVYPLANEQNPVYNVPSNSKGFVINVPTGTYNVQSPGGQIATLKLRLSQNPAPASPVVVSLVCTIVSANEVSYTTLGTEFTSSGPGLYDAELEVTNGGGTVLFPSLVFPRLVNVYGVF
jgi:hypothetical protein